MSAFKSAAFKRLLGCLAAGFMLALMWGNQEGVQNDYSYAFRQAVFSPRILLFLGIGVLLFLALTFSVQIRVYFVRPGMLPLGIGALSIVVSLTLMHWTDNPDLSSPKFGALATAAQNTTGLAPVATAYFSAYIAWVGLIAGVVLAAAAIILAQRLLAWAALALGVVVAVWTYLAHAATKDFLATPDHSLGSWVAVLGFLTIAASGLTIARSSRETAETREFINRLFGWRPGMPLVVLGAVIGLFALAFATWYAPQSNNATLADTHTLFEGTGLASIAVQYLIWLGWVLFAVSLIAAAAACYLRNPQLGWVAVVLGVVSVILTLVTIYDVSDIGAQYAKDAATGPWQDLGAGGWMAAGAFLLLAGAGFMAATTGLPRSARGRRPMSSDTLAMAKGSAPGNQKLLLFVVVAAALFYPPTTTGFWQKVLVSEIGIYVLLAIGLNVVVGWAGLLDLGFIAFYAIGSYTTAYFTGALPIKPPFHLSPLLAIPFAILICLIAGVALGAPTLRLRGDYLAIVTLGFGEIIRIFAVNNPGNITNGPKGAFGIPSPVIHLGPIKFVWGQNQLQYWYLLLVLIAIVLILFNRLENSRLGRAWAAVREDEIAAQATGINTTRVKLLAFAIGASTSGVAGVFFASQIGYINPDNFVLNNSILVVAYVVFGGMGSLPGAMAGAAVLTWLPEFLKDQVPSADRYMWIGAILVAMMIFRPAGLIPARRRKAELSGLHSGESEPRAVPEGEGLGVRV
jgi:ABC-type branched-subunit amino acid transport system permease subunit